DVNGCVNSATNTIEVYALPVVTWTNLLTTQCETSTTYTLTGGNPAGGVYSGPGVTGTNFNASVAGVGVHTLTYTYTDLNSCVNSATQNITVDLCIVNVDLKLFLQGYYLPGTGQTMQPVLNNQLVPGSLATETDTIVVELHHPTTYAFIDSKLAVLSTVGLASATFTQHPGSYFIAIKHRNTLQTWSKTPIACSFSTPLYDFSIAANKAYGDSQIGVEANVWAFYTGNLNGDDYIDGNDFPLYDAQSGSGGLFDGTYTAADMNGDGYVDGNDFPVFDANSYTGTTAQYPQ
ncbi:MAG: hypothetical protein ABI741_15125, partial [Ferruginibacter sp.]